MGPKTQVAGSDRARARLKADRQYRFSNKADPGFSNLIVLLLTGEVDIHTITGLATLKCAVQWHGVHSRRCATAPLHRQSFFVSLLKLCPLNNDSPLPSFWPPDLCSPACLCACTCLLQAPCIRGIMQSWSFFPLLFHLAQSFK